MRALHALVAAALAASPLPAPAVAPPAGAPQGAARTDSSRAARAQRLAGKPRAGKRRAATPKATRPPTGVDSEPPYVQPPMPAALPGSLLPGHRIVTYYGNPLSKRMGILGELPPEEMMARLERVAAEWQQADTATRVLPGLELVATVANDHPGPSGLFRTRMRDTLIERVIGWAERRKWLVILDIQVGHGSVKDEVERLLPFLAKPFVHLALDPEFDLPKGVVPGTKIGSTDAADISLALKLVGDFVTARNLPPKILLVHRFTGPMVTGAGRITLDPRVQLVIVMDGFGPPALKEGSYLRHIRRDPAQYAGFKLFYKNDKPLMTPKEVLGRLVPKPYVIIYQ
ncbi:MAG: hypothetical protein HYX65_09945 [Gemmatimonadetes bacterium]|nr:hypothetical protein [Gemmatimonadota bacterium]